MSCKSITVCALAFFQTICAQIIALPFEPYAYAEPNTYAGPFVGNPAALTASNGCSLSVVSSSPIAPTGVSMVSENAYDGALAVTGTVPFLGAVALEGALPTYGTGEVTYGCGSGNIGIISEDIAAPGYAYEGYGPLFGFDGYAGSYNAMAGLGYAGPLAYGYA